MDWKVFGTAFLTIFLAELGDKTQIATLSIATKTGKPWMVFLGSGLGLVASSAIAVIIGTVFAKTLPTEILSKVAGGLLIVLGILLVTGKL